MSEEELVEKSSELIYIIKKQGFITTENIDLIFTYINVIRGTNEVVTYCTTCVEERLRDLITWVKPRRDKNS